MNEDSTTCTSHLRSTTVTHKNWDKLHINSALREHKVRRQSISIKTAEEGIGKEWVNVWKIQRRKMKGKRNERDQWHEKLCYSPHRTNWGCSTMIKIFENHHKELSLRFNFYAIKNLFKRPRRWRNKFQKLIEVKKFFFKKKTWTPWRFMKVVYFEP